MLDSGRLEGNAQLFLRAVAIGSAKHMCMCPYSPTKNNVSAHLCEKLGGLPPNARIRPRYDTHLHGQRRIGQLQLSESVKSMLGRLHMWKV